MTKRRSMNDPKIEGGNKWADGLDRTEKGGIISSLPNARRIILQHPYLKDCFGWSEKDEAIMIMQPLPDFEDVKFPKSGIGYPCPMQDKHLTYITDMISSITQANFNDKYVKAAVQNAATQNTYDPLVDYLSGLVWDETPRLTEWLHRGFGAEETSLNGSIAFMFLIAAVRRACFRQYKFDSMLVLEGEKGIKKSSGIRELFGNDYFLEGIPDIRRDNSTQILAGMWGVEIPEGKGFLCADAGSQKEFLSKVDDTYRKPYAHFPVTVTRSVVFIMTINDTEYMIDGAGDRRFWPVRCGVSGMPDIDWIRDNRDQIWAEAYLYAMERDETGKLKYKTYMEDAEMAVLTDAQEDRQASDPWVGILSAYFSVEPGLHERETTPIRIARDVLGIPADRQDRSTQIKIGQAMKELGWVKTRRRSGHNREYFYSRPD